MKKRIRPANARVLLNIAAGLNCHFFFHDTRNGVRDTRLEDGECILVPFLVSWTDGARFKIADVMRLLVTEGTPAVTRVFEVSRNIALSTQGGVK